MRLLRSLRRNYKDPLWWRDNIVYNVLRLFERNDGIRILDETWDDLIILDCCRYDVFKKIYNEREMKGELEMRVSRGTWTVEFLKENFTEDCKDTVYVTSNPYVDRYVGGKFYRVVSVWKYGWSDRYKTVLPSEVYHYTLKTMRRYPSKRLIVHFMQPHHPFISLRKADEVVADIRRSVLYGKNDRRRRRGTVTDIYSVNVYGEYGIRTIEKAYEDNLRIVMPYVEALLNELSGTTIITSDHGESFGDRIHPLIPMKFYGHGFTRLRSLVEVPWLKVTDEVRPYRDPKAVRKEMKMVESRLGDERSRIRSVLRRF